MSLLLVLPGVAAADDVMEFSLDEADGSAPAARAGRVDEAAADAHVAKALGELRWGMSSKDVLAVFKARLRAQYDRESRLERDILRQDALYQKAKARYEQIRDGFVRFDDKKNGWDVSPMAVEFRRGSDESMLVVRSDESHDYYFFIKDRLWKWYRELQPSTVGGAGFEGVAEMMRGQLGGAELREQTRSEGDPGLPGLAWDTAATRVTLVQRGTVTCLIFEAQSTLAELPVLRQNALARHAKKNSVIDGVLLENNTHEEVDTASSPVDKITRRKQMSASR